MANEKIILTPFKKAITSLQKALAQPKNEFTRDASIQRFEYTFELAWKFLKRYLKQEAGIDAFNIKDIFREAAHQHLINNVDAWFEYHKARNLTSHTYCEETAEEIYRIAKQFVGDAENLLQNIERFYANPTH